MPDLSHNVVRLINKETMNIIDILWGVGVFTLGMLAGYMLKVVMVNYERIKAREDK